jgi:hypothetical protein
MKLLFSNSNQIDLGINDTILGSLYKKIYTHLSKTELVFRDWDNPYYLDHLTYEELVEKLTLYAHRVAVEIDKNRCLTFDQRYFNEIHKIYELNYNGQPAWLDFHEHIHLCEYYSHRRTKMLDIDYREKSGPLEKPFDLKWLEDSTTYVKAGDVFVTWAELGKTPYFYWSNGEPNDIDRLCRLAKPWLILRPKIKIALEDIDHMGNKKIKEFESWWADYEEPWCRHWNLKSWSSQDMFSSAVVGKVSDLDAVVSLLQNNTNPTGISMS